MNSVFTIKIGGQAGQGIKYSGLILGKFATRSGYNIYNYIEYPSLIRGGHNAVQVSISKEPVYGPSKQTDLLIALNQETVEKHLDELTDDSYILFDEKIKIETNKGTLLPIPLSKIAVESGSEILINTIALGAVIALLGGDITLFESLISEEFIDKDPQITENNKKAAQLGYDYCKQNFISKIKNVLEKQNDVQTSMVIDGTEAIALGAIAGGLQFAAIYPMSPISNVLQVLALYQEKYGYIYKQPEDEISAMNMVIGASFAGARSMTTTSGGGFCLMTEGLGLSAMTETPVVIIEGMRPGPATGLPTWSGQGDLQFILNAHQGDFPRIVLAAGDAKEAFELTMNAFNLADKYQSPVIVLVDKNICEHNQSFPTFDISTFKIDKGKFTKKMIPNYERYKNETDGVSTRTIPGTGNFFITNSYEHDSVGFNTEKVEEIEEQIEKRMKKTKTITNEIPEPEFFGPEDADITLISWGSNKGSILEALKMFNNVNFLHLTWLSPFPVSAIKDRLNRSRHIIDIECNYSGQLAKLIRENTGIEISDKLLKFDGRPFFKEEIVEKINSVLKKI
jgi:2-oxoglutarate/2-oxoacid ferredoxin oxidoreductase subunit alpha